MKVIKPPQKSELSPNEPNLSILFPQDGLLLNHLSLNFQNTKAFLLSIPSEKLEYRYSDGKWTIKEIIAHLLDMERIYSYRMLMISRNSNAALPSFDDNKFVKESNANNRNINDLLEELYFLRESTIYLLNGLPDEALIRTGNVGGYEVSVRALAYHIAGHELHHVNVIKEKYL